LKRWHGACATTSVRPIWLCQWHAAEQEAAFAVTLCSHPAGTLAAVHRHCQEHAMTKTFRALRSRAVRKAWRAFSLVEDDEDDEPDQPAHPAALPSGE
jgi:hypothetical protein